MDKKRSRKSAQFSRALSTLPSTVHSFRISYAATAQSDGAGLVAKVHTFDPSSYTEYSDISGLFSEIRVKRARLHLVPNRPLNSVSGGAPLQTFDSCGIAVGCNLGITSTVPASRQEVWACAGAKVFSYGAVRPFIIDAVIPQMAWATTASPVPGPYAGCYGAFQLYRSGFSATTDVYDYFIELEYEVRGRR